MAMVTVIDVIQTATGILVIIETITTDTADGKVVIGEMATGWVREKFAGNLKSSAIFGFST